MVLSKIDTRISPIKNVLDLSTSKNELSIDTTATIAIGSINAVSTITAGGDMTANGNMSTNGTRLEVANSLTNSQNDAFQQYI